jgi:hypothetical protein
MKTLSKFQWGETALSENQFFEKINENTIIVRCFKDYNLILQVDRVNEKLEQGNTDTVGLCITKIKKDDPIAIDEESGWASFDSENELQIMTFPHQFLRWNNKISLK